ncbi:MAG: S41 family peptidase [Prevotella sp.]|nr:S41 family peptidase [Prevotella sp.]
MKTIRKRALQAVAVCLWPLFLQAQTDGDHNFKVAKNLDVFTSLYKALDMLYVDTLDADETIGTGINAMLRSLDPYTAYYPAEKQTDMRYRMTGKYAGIGALIRKNLQTGRIIVDEPQADMPAAEAGVRKGDVILAIDDSSMVDKTSDYVSSRLRGEAGTSFMLKVKRPSTGKTLKMKITRRAISQPTVPYYGMFDDEVGYISLSQFTEDCAKDIRRAVVDLRKQGMKQLVLDLRNNGGGLENEAVSLVNIFVQKDQLVVSNRGKSQQGRKDYKTTVEPIDTIMPLVVLVNGETASASEITSGALQDLDRAVILGTRTYGKGLVQTSVDLPYNANLMYTVGKYYIPSGRCIQAVNYNHSRGGYVEHVADSLTREFTTAHGRKVRDGGGIMPDMEVRPDTLSNLTAYLTLGDSTECVLNYVVDYVAKHPAISPPSTFELSDEDFEDFKQRVLKSGFSYDHQSGKFIEELEKIVKFEGYYDDARDELEALKKKLTHNLARDIDHNRDELKEWLSKEIISCYYYQAGEIEYSLRHDKQMSEAVALLKDTERYRKLLRP